jgi:hypothetical protein
MSVCHHCKGTGTAPEKITLECIGCQRPVTITYANIAELHKRCENVRCVDCGRAKA